MVALQRRKVAVFENFLEKGYGGIEGKSKCIALDYILRGQ